MLFVLDLTSQCVDPSAIIYSLPDSSFTASTTWPSGNDHNPYHSRLYTNTDAGVVGAWQAQLPEAGQWIQADLLETHTVQGFAIRGRDQSAQYPTAYEFALGLNGVDFESVALSNGNAKIFGGNVDASSIVQQNISATSARFARLIVLAWEGPLIALRWEIYACVTNSKYK